MNCKQQAGVSLVELVVGICMMTLIMSSVAMVFTNLLKNGVQGVDLVERQQEASWATNMITQDLRYATQYHNGVGISNTVDMTVDNSIGGSVEIVYYLLNGVLQRKVIDGGTVVISPVGNVTTDNVNSTSFTVTTTADAATGYVASIQVVYSIGSNVAGTSNVTVQTTAYPLNNVSPGP